MGLTSVAIACPEDADDRERRIWALGRTRSGRVVRITTRSNLNVSTKAEGDNDRRDRVKASMQLLPGGLADAPHGA